MTKGWLRAHTTSFISPFGTITTKWMQAGPGATMQLAYDRQSALRFYTKSASQKLAEIGRAFEFEIDQSILYDHEDLAKLRWRLQNRLGRNNPRATKALTRLYFAYVNRGRAFLDDEILIEGLFEDLLAKFGSAVDVGAEVNTPQRGLINLDYRTVNALMSEYHFLGYGRSDGYHLGMRCEDNADRLSAVATFSPWDLQHVTPVLDRLEIKPCEVLVLSRLLSVPNVKRLTLSQFISHLIRWVRTEMPEIKIVATYCNPNAGHYGTVYRGANFLPLCKEYHSFIPFSDDEYVSPRKFAELHDRNGPSYCQDRFHAGAVTPVPLLIYYYPTRLSRQKRSQIAVGRCACPYPLDLRT